MKEDLRRQMRKARLEGRGSLTRYLVELVRGPVVGLYYPLAGEPYVLALTEWYATAFPKGDKWLLSKLSDLEVGEWGIPAPHEKAVVVQPDYVLVPGLAFDARGGRLGHGRGFYDRLLANYPGRKIGVCWSCQVVDEVPMESHDVRMDAVVTEKGILMSNSH